MKFTLNFLKYNSLSLDGLLELGRVCTATDPDLEFWLPGKQTTRTVSCREGIGENVVVFGLLRTNGATSKTESC